MRTTTSILVLAAAALLGATPAIAQQDSSNKPNGARGTTPAAATGDTTATAAPAKASLYRSIEIQHIRAQDQRGVNVFEAPKEEDVPFTGFKLGIGAAFTQQFQSLSHSNTASPNLDANNVDKNQLISIGSGFNNAVANLYLNAQLAKGIRVAMTSYLSARHHDETWVKDGFLLVDASPFDNSTLNSIMKYTTLRIGHFELNYGDQHFRRSDNGEALFNPFVGNLIMDAFTTEIGGEAYVRAHGFLAMVGLTGGEVHGQVTAPDKRSPAYLGKIGYDSQITDAVRVRMTGSIYTNDQAASNTLYSGDRAGSRYYDVMENTLSNETANAWSGAIQPGFKNKITAMVFNPFVKIRGLEFFGNIEQAKGRASTENADRLWKQYSGEVVYRFLTREQLFVGARYNTANGKLAGMTNDVSVDRTQLGAGWFLTPSVLLKAEYMNQQYHDFPATDIRNGGKIQGMVMEGVVSF